MSLKKVKFDAHARFDAISRTYEYHIKQFKTPFGNELHHVINQSLNFEAMNEGARILLEYEDFECFSKKNTDVKAKKNISYYKIPVYLHIKGYF